MLIHMDVQAHTDTHTHTHTHKLYEVHTATDTQSDECMTDEGG